MFKLYRLTFSSGKCYIGQTERTMQLRIAQHRRSAAAGSTHAVHAAWRKYGEPVVEVMMELASAEEANAAEIAEIARCGTISPNGYNIVAGGETAPSKNPEVAHKISLAATGRKYADTTSWSIASKNKWQDTEYRANVLAGIEKSWTDERREKARVRINAMWAKRKENNWKMPDEQKLKIAERKFSDETRKKMSDAAKGKKKAPRSPETAAKLAQSAREFWANPENKAKRTEQLRAARERKKHEQSMQETG